MKLEEAIKKCNTIVTTKFNNDYSIDSVDKEAIETVLQELKNKDNQIQELQVVNKMQEYRINKMDIPKKKIKDRLQELLNRLASAGLDGFYDEVKDIEQELLEDKLGYTFADYTPVYEIPKK